MKKIGLVLSAFLCVYTGSQSHAASYKFSPVASMTTGRLKFAMILLPNGRVLAAGGQDGSSTFASAEIYNPASKKWKLTAPMSTARGVFPAILLPNGKVLAAGGSNTKERLKSVELYDPAKKRWSKTGSMQSSRSNHIAVLLNNGKVLVSGGADYDAAQRDSIAMVSSEIYDPETGTWTPTGSMRQARYDHQAILLGDGRVLVAGGMPRGVSMTAISGAEIYDPATGVWTQTGSMSEERREEFKMALLPDGRVMAIGGTVAWTSKATDKTEIFDPATGKWSQGPALPATRSGHSLTALKDGAILVASGWEHPQDHHEGIFLNTALVYSDFLQNWTPVDGVMASALRAREAVRLNDGSVLFAGGYNSGGVVADAEVLAVSTISSIPQTGAAGFSSMVIYPNPFQISRDQEVFLNNLPARAELKIYAANGALITQAKDEDGDGIISWNGKNQSGQLVEAGVYYGVLRSGSESTNVKIPVQR